MVAFQHDCGSLGDAILSFMKRMSLFRLGIWSCFFIIVLTGCTSANGRSTDPNAQPADANGQSANVQLQEAIERNDAPAVKSAVARGANINSCANDGWTKPYQGLTPLGIAISSSRPQAALALVEAGADVNRRDYRSEAPPGYAIDYGQAEVLTALLKAGASPNALYMSNSYFLPGQTLLMVAVQKGRAEAVELLLKHGAKAEEQDKYGRTAFWHAGGKLSPDEEQRLNPQRRKIRELLLKAGVNPDPRDYKGRTYAAARELDIDYEEETERERNLAFTDQSGNSTPNQTQLNSKSPPVNKLKNPPPVTNEDAQARLYQAIIKANVDAVKDALKAGAHIDAAFGKAAVETRHDTETPLTLAIRLKQASMVRALLDAGADPMVSASNWPPLHHAARSRDAAIVSALLDKGADPNYGTYQIGETALMHAVIASSVECVKLLLDHGANPDAKTSEGKPITYFLFSNEEEISKLLKQASDKRKNKTSG